MEAIMFVLNLAMVYVLCSLGYRRIKLDSFRMKLFDIRWRIFNLAVKNPKKFGFDSPAYRFLEKEINNYIRYAETFSLFQLLSMSRILKKNGITPKVNLPPLDGVDAELCKEIEAVREETKWLMGKQIFTATVPTSIVSGLYLLIYALYASIKRKKTVDESRHRVVEKANAYFDPDYRAVATAM